MNKFKATLRRKKSMKFQTESIDYKILVMGLESSGKTSIINMIVNKRVSNKPVLPTNGVNIVPFKKKNKSIVFHEIGGNLQSRGLMSYYYSCDAVIYVIDADDKINLTKNAYISDDDNKNDIDKNDDNNVIDDDNKTDKPDKNVNNDINDGNKNNKNDKNDIKNNTNNKNDIIIDNKSDKKDPIKSVTNININTTYKYTDKSTGNLSPVITKFTSPSSSLSSSFNIDFVSDNIAMNSSSAPNLIPSISAPIIDNNNDNDIINNILNKQRASIGPIITSSDHISYSITKLKNISTKSLSLKPLTMNEAKCHSVEELISKLNYELKSNDIPFLIYSNKHDTDNPIKINELLKRINFSNIIDKNRIYSIFECKSFNKEEIYIGWKWLLERLKNIKIKQKQNAKKEMLNSKSNYDNIDLSKYGPTVLKPKCILCDKPCKYQGSFCSVCGKWYCQRDATTNMILRKSGCIKCKQCVGQKSYFIISKRKRKQTK